MPRTPNIEKVIADLIAKHGLCAVLAAWQTPRPLSPRRPRGRPRKDAPRPAQTEPTVAGAALERLVRLYSHKAVELAIVRFLERRDQGSQAGAPKRWDASAIYAWARIEAWKRVHGTSVSEACRAILRDGPVTIVRNLATGHDLIVTSIPTLRRLHGQGDARVKAASARQRQQIEKIVAWHVARLERS